MNRFTALFPSILVFIASGIGLPVSATAQANYENYTFLTLAGPQEAPGWLDGTNGAARFANPFGAASDAAGNVYVADTGNHVIRKVSPAGVVTTLAGLAGQVGSADGVGAAARFNAPRGVVVHKSGDIYVTDTANHTIRKITPTGIVTTFAGTPGVSGTTNGNGTAARFSFPNGMAFDSSSNLFVADTVNHAIRRITPAGEVTVFAGKPQSLGSTNATGTDARFYYPFGLTVDKSNNVYVADTYNHTIRKITSDAVVTTLAGLAGNAGSTDGTGGDARFNYPTGAAAEENGNILVADYLNHTIRRATADGVVTNVAGLAGNYGNVDGTGSAARFDLPASVSLDGFGNAFVAERLNSLIRKVTPAAEVTTVAGGVGGPGSADGPATNARFNYPAAVAVDGSSNVYVADLANHVIRKINEAGAVSTLAGLAGSTGINNGTGPEARFNTPTGVAVDTNGTVYVADTYNQTIRMITTGGTVSDFAGTANVVGTNDGVGTLAKFNYPFGIAVGTNSTLYVADTYNHVIRKIMPDGTVSTLAGKPKTSGTNDGSGGAARFNLPQGIAADSLGNVYVADSGNHAIRKITPAGVVTTLAGSPGIPGFLDATNGAARFYIPFGIAVDNVGNVYAAEYLNPFTGSGNSTVRKITPAGVATTIGGVRGGTGYFNGSGPAAIFYSPEGIATGPGGLVYVADTLNHAIRKGYAAPPDGPVVDLPVVKPGVTCHLDVTNLTTAQWSWSFIRYPANSSAQLSSTTARNPMFTPDVGDMYILRFQGRDAQGRSAIGTVSVQADGTPPTLSITNPIAGQNWSNATFTVRGNAGDNLAVASVFVQINGGDWTNAVGTTSWSVNFALTPGVNTVNAYAVDSAGNVSSTNSVTFNEKAAPLMVTVVGSGSVSPNYNGQWLVMGQTYSMTATPASGFAFTGWTGSATTNATKLFFVMQSNLNFTATFRDGVKPTVVVTSPKASQNVSNALFTATGTAGDNRHVASVWWQLNGGAWTQATGTTNWSAGLTLTPGPNAFRAFAMDDDGNASVTNTVNFTYVLSDRLTVAMTGLGTITPNYNNAPLQIGKAYSMTATPGTGFVFTNWTGSINTNSRTLAFIMQSNLSFTAHFVDIQKPTVTITTPLLNARLSNSVATFQGTAKDNMAVHHVEYQLNNSPFTNAVGTTNWSATVNLTAGTNVFRVKSVDTTGNESLVTTRSVFFVVRSPLTLLTNGFGRVTGATNGQILEIGRGYKVTATAATRNLFALWTGSDNFSATNVTLSFLMKTNLMLQANFVTNPFVVLKGVYYGLFAETNEMRNHDRSGSFTFTLAEAGTYSSSFQLGVKKLSATGKFDWLGRSWLTLKPTPASNVVIALQLDVTNLNASVEGMASNQFWWAPLSGYRAPVYVGTNASPLKGNYTLVIPGSDDAAAYPGGDGYGTVVVSQTGIAKLAGKLGDGTVLSQTIPVAREGLWAFYASLYSAKGSVLGWLTNESGSDIEGEVSWIKPATPGAKFYPLGFTNLHEAVGSIYKAPGTTNRVLSLTNGVVAFNNGNLPHSITNDVLLTTNNKVTNLSSNKLSMTLTLTTGLFTGSVVDTNTGKTILFNGALLQKLASGYGQFLGTNQTGNAYFGK